MTRNPAGSSDIDVARALSRRLSGLEPGAGESTAAPSPYLRFAGAAKADSVAPETVEDAAELQLLQDHVVSLETRPPNVEGKGAIYIRDLVKNSLRMNPDRIIVGEDRYDFSGAVGFGGLDPWGRIREVRVSAPIRYVANQHWTVFAIPSLRFNAESGASLGDGQTGGLLTGVSYRVSDSLSIGPGLGAFTEIEDDASFFPILLIDWAITDVGELWLR